MQGKVRKLVLEIVTEVPIRLAKGDVEQAIGYWSREFRTEV